MTMLELGAGPDPAKQTPGYIHADINAFDGIDIVAPAWEIPLPDHSLDEVIAVGFVEHLTYANVAKTFAHMRRLLKPGAPFLFDVPNLAVWCKYYLDGSEVFDRPYVLRTLFGWQRFPGDEHVSGWDEPLLREYLETAGFTDITISETAEQFVERGIYHYRFTRPQDDAHFYARAT